MAGRVVSLISVGSQRFDAGLLEEYSRWARARDLELFCVMLDGPERYNVSLFDGLVGFEADRVAQARGIKAAENLLQSGVAIHFWNEALPLVPYKQWKELVFTIFEQSSHFRHESINETFRSLQPKFRAHGILKKNHPLVRLAANYLLEEIAFKLAACCSGFFNGEILPRPESKLVMSIYNGEYLGGIELPNAYRIIFHDGKRFMETIVGGGTTKSEGMCYQSG